MFSFPLYVGTRVQIPGQGWRARVARSSSEPRSSCGWSTRSSWKRGERSIFSLSEGMTYSRMACLMSEYGMYPSWRENLFAIGVVDFSGWGFSARSWAYWRSVSGRAAATFSTNFIKNWDVALIQEPWVYKGEIKGLGVVTFLRFLRNNGELERLDNGSFVETSGETHNGYG